MKAEQWQVNTNSVIQKTDDKIDDKLLKKAAELDSSHDEDDMDSIASDSSKRGRGNGRQQRGRKGVNAQIPTTPTKEDLANVQTRRGAKTPAAAKRGRGGRAGVTKTVPSPEVLPTTMPSPANVPSLKQHKTSESDVYEFHDDSGEELAKADNTQRPRLIMTIKSTSTTTAVNTTPVMTSPTQVVTSVASVTQPLPVVTPVIQVVPQQYLSEPASDSQSSIMVSPSSQQVPSPAESDDFAQPNNPRKSRRLQEKDGTRTSVDDTIDDVIRNVALNQAQQAANRRTTRQTVTPAQGSSIPLPVQQVQQQQPQQQPAPPPLPQTMTPTPIDMKKPVKTTKKQKDRKVSESSEQEVEKKQQVEQPPPTTIIMSAPKPNVIQEPTIVQPQPQPQPQPIQIQVQKQVEASQIPRKIFQKESSELLQLIDPVTGELQKMTQSKEGQYVPVSENRIQMPKQLVKPIAIPIPAMPSVVTIEAKHEVESIVSIPPPVQNIVIASTPIIIDGPKKPLAVEQPTQVIRPVITQNPYSKPSSLKNYVLSSQNITKSQVTAPTSQTSSAATVISSQGLMKMAPQHPQTIYNLPNMIPTGGAKFIPQQPQIQKIGPMVQNQSQPTIIHQVPPQVIQQPAHQKAPPTQQVVTVAQPQQKPSGNLMINIPTASVVQSAQSPRMQVKQVIQRTLPSQVSNPSIGHVPSPTVVMKTGQPYHVVASSQDLKTQAYIQQQASSQAPHDGPPLGYMTNSREIIYVDGTVQKQTIYPSYPVNKFGPNQSIPSSHQVLQQLPPQQQPKLSEKAPTQPSVSVTHIQNPHQHQQQQQQQQKVYFTNSGQVITNVPTSAGKQILDPNDPRHPRWISQEKISIQPSQQQIMKSRYVMESYEDPNHHRELQQERAQQQNVQSPNLIKRSFVMEGSGAHQLASPSQPLHHPANVVNQPIIPPQNKTVIGLNQAPQILTGAVASPPLKAHLTSQQPIVTGKICQLQHLSMDFNPNFGILGASSSRVVIPAMSPKDQHHPRHFPAEVYEEAVLVSLIFNILLNV